MTLDKLETATAQLEEAGKLLDAVCVTLKETKLDGEAARVRRIRLDIGNVRKASLGWPKLKDNIARMRAAVRSLGA